MNCVNKQNCFLRGVSIIYQKLQLKYVWLARSCRSEKILEVSFNMEIEKEMPSFVLNANF